MHAAVIFITIKCIYIQANVVNHPYCPKTITQILAQSPENGLVKNIRVVRNQLHRMSGTNRVLYSLSGSFIDQSKAGKPLFVLNFCAKLLIFDPVLERIGWIGRRKNDLAVTEGEGVISLSLGENSKSWFLIGKFRSLVVGVVVNKRWYMGAIVVMIALAFMRDMLDCG